MNKRFLSTALILATMPMLASAQPAPPFDARRDDARTDDARRDDARSDDARRDDARSDDVRRDDARREQDRQREADPHRREKAQEAMHAYYGNLPVQITREEEVGGVHVFDATVTKDGQTAEVSATGTGAIITAGLPIGLEALPPAARQTVELFRAPPTSVTQEDVQGFYISVAGPDRHPYVIAYDAAGRLRDIKSPEQLRQDVVEVQRVGDPESRHIREVVERRFGLEKVEVDSVAFAPHDRGYFTAGFRNRDGRGWAVLNEAEDVIEWRIPMDRRDLPESVREAIEHDLRADRILSIERGASKLFKVTQTVHGQEIVTLLRPNGSVEWINSRALHVYRR